MYRHLGRQYVGGSVESSTKCTYGSGRLCWPKFRRLRGSPDCLISSNSNSHKAWTLIEFASWCFESERNVTKSIAIAGKFATAQYSHRLHVGVKLPVTVSVVQ